MVVTTATHTMIIVMMAIILLLKEADLVPFFFASFKTSSESGA